MSSHFAKTNAPAANAGGNQNRRTPLSLTGAGKAAGSKNAASSTVAVNQATDKNDKSNTAANVADAATAINKDVEMKKSSSKNTTDVINVNKDPEVKKSQLKQDEISSSTSSQENGYTNGHKRNDHKNDDKKMNTSETANTEKKDSIQLRESQRKKDKQQQKVEKDSPRKAESTMSNEKGGGGGKKNEKNKDKISEEGENKKKNSLEKGSDKKDISAEGEALKKEESKIMNVIEIQDEKKTKESQEPSPKELEKQVNKKQETISVTEREQLQDVKAQNESSKMQSKCSAVNEKYEMEPLIFENEGEIPGHPDASSTPGKILKHREGPLSGEQKSKTDTLITDSATSAINSEKTATTSDCSYSYTYSRSGKICGRKSFRPLPEISFENRYRGYYRPLPDDDRFSSSMNVTVGSEIRNESTNNSFSFFSRGKKRERTPPPQLSQSEFNQIMYDTELSPKSPKRARLDFSGLFGSVASPITKLLSKFSRAKIHTCSTPNVELKKKHNNNPDVISINDEDKKTGGNGEEIEDVLNVSSVIADDDTAVLDDGNDESMMEGGDVVSIAVDGDDIKDNTVNLKLTEDKDYDNDDNIIIKEKSITTTLNESANKRKICNVM